VVSRGNVDVKFRCLEREIGLSVDSKINEKDIQRLVANSLQLNLNGYWVATIIEGLGRVSELVSGSTVELIPATSAQIQRVVRARTMANADPESPKASNGASKRKAQPGTASPNWLAIQASREERIEWIKFGQELERDKMVHVITDGGARPNPGAAGWGVLMRQSGKYAENWGHWDMASNNAMEFPARNGMPQMEKFRMVSGNGLCSLYMEKCGDSQRNRREDCVILAHHTSLRGDVEDSRMRVSVGGTTTRR
jgi:hypothetical protein